ncbi:trehalose-phosphatase [Candidatus Omnitrophota bacterium]
MRYLFSQREKVLARIKTAPSVFLFLDYDGTLTPIVSTPEKARLHSSTKNILKRLIKNPKISLAIVSGRSLKDIKKMVGLKGIIYAGNHGLEIENHPYPKILKSKAIFRRFPSKAIYIALKSGLSHIRGVRVEDKGSTLSVHFRMVKPEKKALTKKIFSQIVAPYLKSKSIRLSSGKMVLEVRPLVEWDTREEEDISFIYRR